MFVIGIAGGVASGKSLVARCFQHLGGIRIDADRIGHQVLRLPEVIDEAEAAWGKGIIDDNREIVRESLAKIVFGPDSNPADLKKLESITHPRITTRIQAEIQANDPESVLVMDAPVMFKAGWDRWCDKIVFVEVPLEIRQQRAATRGWAKGEIERRESRQTPLVEKRRRATDLVNNSGSKEETYHQVKLLWKNWNLLLPTDLGSPSSLF